MIFIIKVCVWFSISYLVGITLLNEMVFKGLWFNKIVLLIALVALLGSILVL